MVDPMQLILIIVIAVLTILFVILGIQVFLILREIRRTLMKTNNVLANAESITEHIRDPLSALSSLSLKAGSLMTVIKMVKSFIGRDKDADERRM